MNDDRVKVIKLRVGMSDPKGILIPRGLKEEMSSEIADGVATFWFKNPQVTRRWAKIVIALEKKRDCNDTIYIERSQKIVTKYTEMNKEQIRDLILTQLKQMGMNSKLK